MRIAVIGAGTSGLAAAAFLNKSGHDVIIYEKFESPRPLGAGIMLQPTGLAVLANLGLDKVAIESSSKIFGIQGHVVRTGKIIFDISYSNLAPHVFGLGIHRNTLFSLLYDEVVRRNIKIINSACINDIAYEGDKPAVMGSTYDVAVVAQGARSSLRQKFLKVKKDKPYPYAALWGVCRDHEGRFKNRLYQRYLKAKHMIGVMPMGKLNSDAVESVAFFWSLRSHEYEKWRGEGLAAWQNYVVSLWPEVELLIRQFKTIDDLNFATYGDVCLHSCYNNRVVFIGDAAHATSPQLGQGANLGLLDAYKLDECFRQTEDVNSAIKNYAKQRKAHVRFYQTASHWLTPFFQSDSIVRSFLRDITFGVMCKMPFVKNEMVRTLSGIKTGLFTNMDPGEIHCDYDLKYTKQF